MQLGDSLVTCPMLLMILGPLEETFIHVVFDGSVLH